MRDHRQLAVIDVLLETGLSVLEWLERVSELLPRLYETAPDVWAKLEWAIRKTRSSVDHMIYEQEIAPGDKAATAIRLMRLEFGITYHRLSKALTQADQALGRRAVLGVFGSEGQSHAEAQRR